MDYGMIGKIEKAKRYAEQRNRMRFLSFEVAFDGDNSQHTVKHDHGTWSCTCNFFKTRGVCSHTMALERVLEDMLMDAPVEEGEA
ncbi:MAG: hypothetical protein JXN59_06515 [Anaerolineae bacterium]|nr:hypothetical protein [Anaerolineae bacterium]